MTYFCMNFTACIPVWILLLTAALPKKISTIVKLNVMHPKSISPSKAVDYKSCGAKKIDSFNTWLKKKY